MPSLNKTETIQLSQYQSNEYQKRTDVNEDNLKIDNKFKSVDAQLSDKLELYVNETLPSTADRKENIVYFKVTDTISFGTADNIKVSPTMGLKLE